MLKIMAIRQDCSTGLFHGILSPPPSSGYGVVPTVEEVTLAAALEGVDVEV